MSESQPELEQAQFAELMSRVRAGSDEAVHELLERYGAHIQRAVRRRLHRRLRSKFDSQDFVQAVWASFFGNLEQVGRFDDPQQLMAFLARIAGNKVIDEYRRRMQTEKNDVTRELSLDGAPQVVHETMYDQQPTPSEFLMAKEQWYDLIGDQPRHYAEILRMRASGAKLDEISETLQIDPSTVRRVIRRLSGRIPRYNKTDKP